MQIAQDRAGWVTDEKKLRNSSVAVKESSIDDHNMDV